MVPRTACVAVTTHSGDTFYPLYRGWLLSESDCNQFPARDMLKGEWSTATAWEFSVHKRGAERPAFAQPETGPR